VALLKWRPFVLEVRDLWPGSIVELGQMKRGLGLRVLEMLETLLYRSASGIVVVTRSFEAHIQERGIDPDRIHRIYNGIDSERFFPMPPSQELLEEHDLQGRFLVAYVGTLGLAHGLMTVIEAATRCQEQGVTFLFIGDGADRARLEAEVASRKLDNVRFLGLLPREQIPEWIATIDVLLVMLRDLEIFHTVIPSKIFEFLAQERPLILAAKGEIREMVAEAGAATIIDPENTEQLVDGIAAIQADLPAAKAKAVSGREWVLADFQRNELARRMASFLESVVQRG